MKAGSLSRRLVLAGAIATVIRPGNTNGQNGSNPASEETYGMKVRFTFNNRIMVASLYDNPSAADFASLLPLELTIDNYANNEKIAYLPRKLTQAGSGPFGNERPGDLCYFAPWGNLALFYGSYRYSAGLIRLGRFEAGFEPLLVPGKFPLRIERTP
ncbi:MULTISPECIES: cyclophilin-like fold protein [unclassified Rhizobium]|uniref:cyclophilin-like fold protein n=1 Tax=unclassified Rhizobium TaxID=2613769 RepID=UPI000EA9BB47|nr:MULTISPECIES: cyclophilin-like fold protein [unclassified Rhizobium]AYG69836.1 MFS transporter [Rhizobium sp. CCGE531]AYG76216.1 MFS transporter [Rhizobium sp. CCGE532]